MHSKVFLKQATLSYQSCGPSFIEYPMKAIAMSAIAEKRINDRL